MGDRSRVYHLGIRPATQAGQLSLLPSAEREEYRGAVAVYCGWEGNRGSGVAPTGRHRLRYSVVNSLRKGDERPVSTYASVVV